VASDERLIFVFPDMLVGRLILYLSVPLATGIYFDIVKFRRDAQKRLRREGRTEDVTVTKAATAYLKGLQGRFALAGSLATLIAPGLFAAVRNLPLVTTYFDLLEKVVTSTL